MLVELRLRGELKDGTVESGNRVRSELIVRLFMDIHMSLSSTNEAALKRGHSFLSSWYHYLRLLLALRQHEM
jgi:hypothetical protein